MTKINLNFKNKAIAITILLFSNLFIAQNSFSYELGNYQDNQTFGANQQGVIYYPIKAPVKNYIKSPKNYPSQNFQNNTVEYFIQDEAYNSTTSKISKEPDLPIY
jgi:hypothetical protein